MSTPAARALVVWSNHSRIGELQETGNLWRFEYDPEWRASGAFDLSPALLRAAGPIADGASSRPVQWFFDNLLPEEGARALLAKDAAVPTADVFGLLSYYGAESAGALTLLPPGRRPDEGGLQALPAAELSRRIRDLPQTSLNARSPKRMSLAGAQHKLAVVLRDGQLFEPIGHAPSTHILKPDNVDPAYPHTTANEWFCMRLAAAIGVRVPPVALLHVPEPVYLIERFDRRGQWPVQERRHTLDACQLLNLSPSFKYSEATFERLREVLDLVRAPAPARRDLLGWVYFNLLIGNNDSHLKNLSFFMDRGDLALTPFYDLLSTAVYQRNNDWLSDELVWSVEGVQHLDDVDWRGALRLADALGVPAAPAARIREIMTRRVVPAADALIAEAEAMRTAGPGWAGALRLLRQIRFGVLVDMLKRLSPP